MTTSLPIGDVTPARTERTSEHAPPAAVGSERRFDLLLDLQRILLLLAKILKFGLFPLASYFPVPTWRQPFEARLRRSLEELGLTYLKFGQFLAIRFDILPPAICRELSRLFDQIPGMSFATARAIVESELGQSLEDLFLDFRSEPVAAASVGQVHEAHLWSGQRVAVKIQRLGLRRVFLSDIRNLHRLAALLEPTGWLGSLALREMVDEFSRWTLRELDFVAEGRVADRLRLSIAPFGCIPRVYWDLTSTAVLTMEFIAGLSAAEVGDLMAQGGEALVRTRLAGFDVKIALHHFAEISMTQAFTDGFFHADAHPGNVFFLENNVIALIDFGIFGELNEKERVVVSGHVYSVALGDIAACYRYYRQQLIPTAETDEEAVRQESMSIMRTWYQSTQDPSLPLEERHLSRYIGAAIDVARRNGLRFRLDYLLFWRALNSLNATAWRVDPRFDLLAELRQFFARTQTQARQALRQATDPNRSLSNILSATGWPRRIERALEEVAGPPRPWPVHVQETARRRRRSSIHARWLAGAILLATAAALLRGGPLIWPLALGFGGFVLVAVVLSLWRQP